MENIIAIDHGNSIIKLGSGGQFPAGLADAHGIADETVEYHGKQYALSNRRLPYMRDKTATPDYFVLTLFAIGREMEGPEGDIDLAVGLPPAHFKTGRAAFEAYFTVRSPILFKYNGCPLTVRIKRMHCFPQAYAAAMTQADMLTPLSRAFVMDIGGMTVDTLLLRNGVPDMAYTMSLEGGVNRLYNDIARALSSELGVRAEQDQIEAVLQMGMEHAQKCSLFDFSAIHLMERTAERFTTRLLNDLREHDIDLKTTPAMFIGGGALLLWRFLAKSPMVKNPWFVEDVCANAKGYKLLAEAALRSSHDGTELQSSQDRTEQSAENNV
jgi:plasmid segregation protein ParM